MQRAHELGFDGRQQHLAARLPDLFDFPFMARKSAGRHWKSLKPEQQATLIEQFSQLSIATYAARFDGYGGEKFETLGEKPAAHGTVLVHTQLVKRNGDPVRLDYRLRPTAESWRIIDVFLDARVSELALRRAEYSSVIKRSGFEGLVEGLKKKIAARRAEKGP